MIKKTRDFNAAECMVWMYKYNQGKVNIHMEGDYPKYLISLVPISELKFPDGWYYSKDANTINREDSSVTVHVDIKE